MSNLEYTATDESGLELVGHLWWKLNEHHRQRSPHFAGHFSRMTFDHRKKRLLGKIKTGKMRVDYVTDTDTGRMVGFCVSSVAEGIPGEIHGEIDTLFIEEEYRRTGIGDRLMQRALEWMDSLSARRKRIEVAVGNEEVLPFYRRYGFLPGATTLMHLDAAEADPEN